ncbi:MAG: cytochrome bc complex cytochrome b subunit [Planctomycetaceae bacterium]
MFGKLYNWIDSRTGVQESLEEALYENIPGGAKWRYVSGSMLVFAFMTQAITGIFLWMNYSAGSQNAWASVYYITYNMEGGALLRGIHHVMAQAMVCLLPIHILQVVIEKAYVKPREFNWWLGLVLMKITLALGLTGYLLPWDQKGYWATKVATELAALPPVVGGYIQKIVVGGNEYGHFTLTRFFALHAGVLPGLLVGFLVLHLAMFRKHGITAHSSDKRPDQMFWPMQVLKDGVACALLFGLVIFVAIVHPAELGPPAEPTEPYGAARPEWYFLFLFQMLKYFDGSMGWNNEFVGAIVFPGLLFGFMFLMPFIARIRIGHALNVLMIALVVGGAGYLTWEAIQEDNYNINNPDDTDSAAYKKAAKFHAEVARADTEFRLIDELVKDFGIPLEGPLSLQQKDPYTMGVRLFRRQCASCHAYNATGENAHLAIQGPVISAEAEGPMGAPDLYGFGSPAWIKGLLSDGENGIGSAKYFGNTSHSEGEMIAHIRDTLWAEAESEEDRKNLEVMVEEVSWALSVEARLPYLDYAGNQEKIKAGINHLNDDTLGCVGCHNYQENEFGYVFTLDNYASSEWLTTMISDPNQIYSEDWGTHNDRMPAFHSEATKLLTADEIELLVRFLRQDRTLLGTPSATVNPLVTDETQAETAEDSSGEDSIQEEAEEEAEEEAKEEAEDLS